MKIKILSAGMAAALLALCQRRYHATWRANRQFLDCPDGGTPAATERIAEVSDEHLLGTIRRLYETHGYVNRALIAETPGLPSVYRIFRRYATLAHLCAAAGLPQNVSLRKPLPPA